MGILPAMQLRVALIRDVFFSIDGEERLRAGLGELAGPGGGEGEDG